MYYKLKEAYDNVYSMGKKPNLGEVELDQGWAIDPKELPSKLEFSIDYSEDDPFPDYVTFSHAMLLSQRFIDLLIGAGVDNLQLFPVELTNDHDGVVYTNYSICNIVGLVKCADMSKSVYDSIDEHMHMFDELAIDLSKTNGALLFRLAESRSCVMLHKTVCEYILNNDTVPETSGYDWDKLDCS